MTYGHMIVERYEMYKGNYIPIRILNILLLKEKNAFFEGYFKSKTNNILVFICLHERKVYFSN